MIEDNYDIDRVLIGTLRSLRLTYTRPYVGWLGYDTSTDSDSAGHVAVLGSHRQRCTKSTNTK